MNRQEVEDRYRALLGHVPENIQRRLVLAELADHGAAVTAVEALREALIHDNPLDARTQQMIHFGMLIALGKEGPARLHAQGALRAGATAPDLFGVCETAAIVAGMPAFSLGVDLVYEALSEAGMLPPGSR